MFRHRQQLHRWAALTLLLWLFGFGVSAANACFSAGSGSIAAASASLSSDAPVPPHGPTLHEHFQLDGASLLAQGDAVQADLDNSATVNCLDFCGKARVSIPPLKSVPDDIQVHAAIAMAAVTVLPMPAYAPVQLWVPRRDGVRAPPILIAFVRLAL
ncbi:MAG: hypothetical protein IV103_13815 [Zoogloea sp.]|nr:hypothetical protein [Zoogloea sp.]